MEFVVPTPARVGNTIYEEQPNDQGTQPDVETQLSFGDPPSSSDKIQAAIEKHGVDVLGPTELKNWKRIHDFVHNVSEILAHVADVLGPEDFDTFIA